MVASRNAGTQPFLVAAPMDSTSSSAASKSAWSSIRVSERRAGRPSYSLECRARFSVRQICTGAAPNWAMHDVAQPYALSLTKSQKAPTASW